MTPNKSTPQEIITQIELVARAIIQSHPSSTNHDSTTRSQAILITQLTSSLNEILEIE